MAYYLVSYDLRKPGRDYEELYAAIKSHTKWARVLESLWAISTNNSAVQIRDELSQHVDSNDGLFIIETGSSGAWRHVLCESQWLKDNLWA